MLPTNSPAHARYAIEGTSCEPYPHDPKGDHPELLEDWPVEGDLVIPVEKLHEALNKSMGQAWREREANRKVLEQQGKQ